MRVALDANVLLRLIVEDDTAQHQIALDEVRAADRVIIPTVALCETVWVLSRHYRFSRAEIALALERLLDVDKTDYDDEAVDAGLIMLKAGGDFADAVIALEGVRVGGDLLLTFDRKAVRHLSAMGAPVRLAGAAT